MPKSTSREAAVTGRRNSISNESSARAIILMIGSSFLRPAALRSTFLIFRNFFLLQYKAALLPGRKPVSKVDHALDEKIPFSPDKVDIYGDFINFYARLLGFLIRNFGEYGKEALVLIRDFIAALGMAYGRAAEVYAENFSTTNRPKYLARFKFLVIHAFDPHLMCIPSLHVMVVILAYTRFKKVLYELSGDNTAGSFDAESLAALAEEARQKALAITEAVLYIKQHSVNCIPAAMYAMTRFDGLFTPAEAEAFSGDLFRDAEDIPAEDTKEIRGHILKLYKQFLEHGRETNAWQKPLLDFLGTFPKAVSVKNQT